MNAPICTEPQTPLTIGVLALQGDVREHLRVLDGLGVRTRSIRRATELDGIDGIVIPGGESTTMSRLLDVFELREPLQERLDAGLPAYGSCAGMIMLATHILDGRADQVPLKAIDITVRRNAFGRQVDSFESEVSLIGLDSPIPAVFIRAPWVESVGDGVEVLGTAAGHPVAARTERVLVTSFHPEITGDTRVHELFVRMVREAVHADLGSGAPRVSATGTAAATTNPAVGGTVAVAGLAAAGGFSAAPGPDVEHEVLTTAVGQ